MLEKHIWICAVMTVGAKHGCKVGEVEKDHNEEVLFVIKLVYNICIYLISVSWNYIKIVQRNYS